MTSDCVFCALLDRRSPASFVYKDEQVAAFLDLFPVHSGHTLVVPRQHVADLLTCPPDVVGHLFRVSVAIAPAVVATVGGDGFNVWAANGRAAGQEVFHLHLHILPRHRGDAFGLRFPKGYPTEADRSELESLAARIRFKL